MGLPVILDVKNSPETMKFMASHGYFFMENILFLPSLELTEFLEIKPLEIKQRSSCGVPPLNWQDPELTLNGNAKYKYTKGRYGYFQK